MDHIKLRNKKSRLEHCLVIGLFLKLKNLILYTQSASLHKGVKFVTNKALVLPEKKSVDLLFRQ